MPTNASQTTSNIIGLLDNFLQAKNSERANYKAPVQPEDYRGQLSQEIDLQTKLTGIDFSGLPIENVDTKGESDIINNEITRLIGVEKSNKAAQATEAAALKTSQGFKGKLEGELEIFRATYPSVDFTSIDNSIDLVDTEAEIKTLRAAMNSLVSEDKAADKPESRGSLVTATAPDGSKFEGFSRDLPKGSTGISKIPTAKSSKAEIQSDLNRLKTQYERRSIVKSPATGSQKFVAPSEDLFPVNKRMRMFELQLQLDKDLSPDDKIVRSDADGNLFIVGQNNALSVTRQELQDYLKNR